MSRIKGIGFAASQDFRRRRDALLLPLGDHFGGTIQCRARLHFGEDQRVTPRGDDVDLANWAFPAPRQNAVAVRDQPGGGAAFGGQPEPEGGDFF